MCLTSSSQLANPLILEIYWKLEATSPVDRIHFLHYWVNLVLLISRPVMPTYILLYPELSLTFGSWLEWDWLATKDIIRANPLPVLQPCWKHSRTRLIHACVHTLDIHTRRCKRSCTHARFFSWCEYCLVWLVCLSYTKASSSPHGCVFLQISNENGAVLTDKKSYFFQPFTIFFF